MTAFGSGRTDPYGRKPTLKGGMVTRVVMGGGLIRVWDESGERRSGQQGRKSAVGGSDNKDDILETAHTSPLGRGRGDRSQSAAALGPW